MTTRLNDKGYNGAGVYIFRTRRPGLFGRVPLIGRHFAYVGESGHVRFRRSVHIKGSVKYNAFPKPWSDLKPSWYFIPIPFCPKRVLRFVETLLMLLTWPVYNDRKNRWNPRRIPLKAAKRQRGSRDVCGWSFNFRYGHVFLWIAMTVLTYENGWWKWLA